MAFPPVESSVDFVALEERVLARWREHDVFAESLLAYRDLVIGEIRRIIAGKRFRKALSRRLAEYPLREGKGLRPALCLATCQAYGGSVSEGLPSAAALELFHNAFVMRFDAGSVPVGNLVFSSDDPNVQLKDLQDAALFKVRPLFATRGPHATTPPRAGRCSPGRTST